ncbi:CBS domain-containing protein [Micromonospora polyrhachis]|uniref:CBS domain-containing protein n=1 Tax=Micromonospora polyrhachis TaxID=1282883 RepID=A0A7W7WRN5_9ACTN|nr:CBS domain-containing protein [Micromonospora polyrhachis]MBB4960468.1 CBS domain-containing protein [Micromonospora polyrhachis]
MTTVGEFMTTRLVTMDGTDTLTAAAQEMRDRSIGDVIVTDGDAVLGIVTDRDITVRGVAEELDVDSATLNQILSQDVVTVSQYDDAVAAADLMRTYGVRRLPVLEDGRLVGLVSLGDIAVEREPQSVLADISADEPNN